MWPVESAAIARRVDLRAHAQSLSPPPARSPRIPSPPAWRSPSPPPRRLTPRSSGSSTEPPPERPRRSRRRAARRRRSAARRASSTLEGRRVVAPAPGHETRVDADAVRDAAAAAVRDAAVDGRRRRQRSCSTTTSPLSRRRAGARRRRGRAHRRLRPGRLEDRHARGRTTSPRSRIVTDARRRGRRPAGRDDRRWANRARDLVNRPGNDLTPAQLRRLRERDRGRASTASPPRASVPTRCAQLGMGALLAVGAGSVNEPRVIVLRYEPSTRPRRSRARSRRQGHDVRLGRHLAQAGDAHGGHEGRHGRRGDRRRRHRRACRERMSGACDRGRRGRREHARADRACGRATSSRPPTARRSRSRTRTRRVGSCSPTRSGTRASSAPPTSSTSRR